jgi:hypothetical protein
MEKQNLYKIDSVTYHVRTQAGFKKALKEQADDKYDRDRVIGHPTVYPCIVQFTHHEYFGIRVKCTLLSKYLIKLKRAVATLEAQDKACLTTKDLTL